MRDWTCGDVGSWMQSHGWAWRELDHYTARICEVGVHGVMLYDVEGVLLGTLYVACISGCLIGLAVLC